MVSSILSIGIRSSILLSVFGFAAADEFPMRGQTWVFLNGPNEDTHIVQSVGEFAPSSVIVATFNQDGTVDTRYSNLSGRFLKSTAEALDTVAADLKRNEVLHSSAFTASRQNVPDTAYSCDEELTRLAGTARYSGYYIKGQSVQPSRDSRNWQWFFEAPECYATRPARAQDRQEKNRCVNHWCSSPLDGEDAEFKEGCDEAFIECRAIVEEESMRSRPSSRMFWNLHIYPLIILHPRHPATGRVMKEISMSQEEAEAKRQEALGDPSNQNLKPYLNPILDDSASVYFSGQFLWPEAGPNGVWSISMDVSPEGEGATGFYHDPPAAYRIQSYADVAGLQSALLLPFAKGKEDVSFLSELDQRCPGWPGKDRIIGQKAFRVQSGLSVVLPDILPPETSDPAWTRTRQERVAVNGGWQIRTIVEENRTLEGQAALIRDPDFPYGDYFWKGCPDLEDATFKLTKSQLTRILASPIPTCNAATLAQSEGVYRRIQGLFTRPEEVDEKALAGRRADEAAFLWRRDQGRERPAGFKCPDSPLDILLGKAAAP